MALSKDWGWEAPTKKPTGGELVLVTGASGYIGSHVVGACLAAGYRVRGTVRKLESNSGQTLMKLFPFLELKPANLTDDKGWEEALKDVTIVLHVASPYAYNLGPEEMKEASMGGAMRVLKFAKNSPSVKRFVLVSSIKAVRFTETNQAVYGPKDFSCEKLMFERKQIYGWSKAISEKAAWEFIKDTKPSFEFCTVNPGAVWGPVLAPWQARCTSSDLVKKCLMGDIWCWPQMMEGMVDVRDVADVLCSCGDMSKKVNGERFIAAGQMHFLCDFYRDALKIFKTSWGYNDLVWATVPTWVVWFVRLCKGNFLETMYPYLGHKFTYDTANTRKMLPTGKFRDAEKACVDHAHSILHYDEKKQLPKYKAWLEHKQREG